MKKGLDQFKEALIEGETFGGEMDKVTSIEEAYEIAKRNGYDFTMEELENSEISDDILDCVAGGKGDSTTNANTYRYLTTNDSENNKVRFLED